MKSMCTYICEELVVLPLEIPNVFSSWLNERSICVCNTQMFKMIGAHWPHLNGKKAPMVVQWNRPSKKVHFQYFGSKKSLTFISLTLTTLETGDIAQVLTFLFLLLFRSKCLQPWRTGSAFTPWRCFTLKVTQELRWHTGGVRPKENCSVCRF